MVQIDAVVYSAEESKKFLSNKDRDRNKISNIKVSAIPDKRFKLVSPHQGKCCDNCMFFTFNFLMKHPFISLIICGIFLVSFAFVGPSLCYIECFIQTYNRNEITEKVKNCESTRTFIKKETHQQYSSVSYQSDRCLNIRSEDRLYCIPKILTNEEECVSRGCCWLESTNESLSAPHCFYPSNYKSYEFINVTASDTGAVAFLKLVRNSTYSNNIPVIRMNFNYWAESMLEVKVSFNLFISNF